MQKIMQEDILKILPYGNLILREKSLDIKKEADIQKLITSMIATMQNASGCGLAAPQIGNNINLFITDFEDKISVFVNPKIITSSSEFGIQTEMCLSLPNLKVEVPRAASIEMEYFDENWAKKKKKFSGYFARILQHEYDHLLGKLIIDYVSPLQRKLMEKKLLNITKGKISVRYPIKY